MTFLSTFDMANLAFLCHLPCRCIGYQEWIRPFLREYQVFVTDAKKPMYCPLPLFKSGNDTGCTSELTSMAGALNM